jgi:periplasmic protein TonB
MFQQTFIPEVHSGHKPFGIAVSVITQGMLLALLGLALLLISQPVPTAQLRALLVGPAPPVVPEKPMPRANIAVQPKVTRVRSFRLIAPIVIPKQINTLAAKGTPEAPDVTDVAGFSSGQSLLTGVGGAFDAIAPPAPAPKEQPEIKPQRGPLAIGGNVAAGNLVHNVEPTYPPLAKAARIQGVVVFQAVIGIDGQIRNLQLKEGHALLVEPVRSAILQWRYRPTLLNGRPVEVVTTITVHFALSQ